MYNFLDCFWASKKSVLANDRRNVGRIEILRNWYDIDRPYFSALSKLMKK